MNVNFNRIKMVLALLLLTSAFNACVRERDTDTEQASDSAFGDFVYENAFSIAEDAATKNTGENLSNYKTTGYCATLTHDKVSNPRTITIDFGAVNCLCNDNRNRRGKILVTYTGNFSDSNETVTLNFDQYYVDDNAIFGTATIYNMGLNVDSHPYSTFITDGKFLKVGTLDTVYWTGDRVRTIVQGSDTPVWGDDVYEYVGTGTGKGAYKSYYAMNITEPLRKTMDCRYFTSGKVELQPQGKALRVMNYGNGECDDDATVIINNKSFNIKL
ncbi:MAG: hypothetical protein JNJ58_01610 [Chitinophagaceae bacterium]|nr:hypothetical protein [Chitinophagaceae bacterium]